MTPAQTAEAPKEALYPIQRNYNTRQQTYEGLPAGGASDLGQSAIRRLPCVIVKKAPWPFWWQLALVGHCIGYPMKQVEISVRAFESRV
jgi:hypothetical protein